MPDDLTPVITPCGLCVIKVWVSSMFFETCFLDGTKVPAAPNFDAASCSLAASLGYKTTWDMSREHEALHTFLAVQAGLPYFSPTLWAVAHGVKLPRGIIPAEEDRVLAFQAVLNGQPAQAALDYITDLPTLVAQARRFLTRLTDPRQSIIDPRRRPRARARPQEAR